jgi:predicted PurR-regulated permease PerM
MSKEMIVRILYVVVLVGTLSVLVFPFVIPIVFAATIALTLKPLHTRLVRKGLSSGGGAGLLTALFAVVISAPVSFFIVKGTIAVTAKLEELAINEKLRDQGVNALVKDIRHDFIVAIHKYSSRFEFLDFLNERNIDRYLGIAVGYLLEFFRDFLAQIPTLFILLLIMILCTFSFLRHAGEVRSFFQALLGFSDEKMDKLVHIFIMDSRSVYLSNIVTGGLQSLLVAAGVRLLGLADFFLVFFITLILSFIPVVGAAPVAFVFALLGLANGNVTAAIILGCLGVFTGVVDNFLRPWLATFGESKITPVFAFVCVIGGALWLGFPGLFIGLLLGSYAYDTLPLFWEEMELRRRPGERGRAEESLDELH